MLTDQQEPLAAEDVSFAIDLMAGYEDAARTAYGVTPAQFEACV
jgi:hypothetical protein